MRATILLALSLLFVGCTGRAPVRELLRQAEATVAEAPDSALHLLQGIAPTALGNRAGRARYALLYAEAADRAGVDADCGPMLREARDFYRSRPHELRRHCRALYYLGRARLRKGDKPGALRLFLEIEERLRSIDEPYYLGLLYLRIGEVYHDELNFVQAYRYYRDARDLFIRSDESRLTAEALLGMTASSLRMRDVERTRRNCTLALDLADELHDEALAKRCLAQFAALYAATDPIRIPEELLQRIERSVRSDTTAAGCSPRAQTHLLRGRPDSARRNLNEAFARNSDIGSMPMLLYTSYRIEERAGRYREALQELHRFTFLGDSLTRTALQASAGMIEKEYFRERAAFADYRIRNRRIREIAVSGIALLLLGIAGFFIRQRIRLDKERNERSLLLIREAQSEYLKLSGSLRQRQDTEAQLKGVIASRFSIVDQLGKTLYERENTASGQAAMVRQVKQLIEGFAENGEMLRELEQIVDLAHDDAMRRLREEFPKMKESDVRLLCYIFGGFSPQVISLFMNDSVANVYARKSRIKARIKASETPSRELFVDLLG